jgi:4-hydroxy-4-methyl-2-oxoglutarate aldolase
MAFPVFATGMSPLDSAGRSMVVEYGGTIACGGVVVHEGDLVVGDIDGLIVVPRAIEGAAILRALEKVEGENTTRTALEQGMTLTEVYAKYGVL